MEKDRNYYKELTKTKKDFKQITRSFIFAFLGGGLISIFGQVVLNILNFFNKETPKDNPIYLSMFMILLSGILTGLGVYDKLGQIFKCGFSIPITGEASRGDTHFLISIYKYMYITIFKNRGKIRRKLFKMGEKVVFFVIVKQKWGEILKKVDETLHELKSV